MKRFVAMLAVLTLVAAAPITHFAVAKRPAKVDVCHVNSANDFVELVPGFRFVYGKVISVSERAAANLVARGDSTDFFILGTDERDKIENELEVSLPNANCYFLEVSD